MSEQAKHTAGPWETIPRQYSGPDIVVVPIETGEPGELKKLIARVAEQYDEAGTEAEANARLIAAAPDLLAALKECEWVLANLAPMLDEAKTRGIGFGCNPQGAREQARAAIAKAEGRA